MPGQYAQGAPPWDISAYMQNRERILLENEGARLQLIQQQQENQVREREAQEAEARKPKEELSYSTKQRQDVAIWENAKQDIVNNPNFSIDEKSRAIGELDLKINTTMQSPTKKLVDPNKFQWPEGTGLGKIWKDQSTNAYFSGTMDAKGNPAVKLMVRPDQTLEYQQEEIKSKKELAALTTENLREGKMIDTRLKLATDEVDMVDNKGAVIGTRFREKEEIDKIMQKVYGESQQIKIETGPSDEEMETELKRRVQLRKQQAQPWWIEAEKIGYKISESDKKLPKEVGTAQAYIRAILGKYKSVGKIPPQLLPAFRQAKAILQQYAQTVSK